MLQPQAFAALTALAAHRFPAREICLSDPFLDSRMGSCRCWGGSERPGELSPVACFQFCVCVCVSGMVDGHVGIDMCFLDLRRLQLVAGTRKPNNYKSAQPGIFWSQGCEAQAGRLSLLYVRSRLQWPVSQEAPVLLVPSTGRFGPQVEGLT